MINIKSASKGGASFILGSKLVRGQVSKIIFSDDPSNTSKKFVQYEVVLENGDGSSSTILARKVSDLFGANDYSEEILEPSEYSYSGTNDIGNSFGNRNGALVLVGFLNSNVNDPVIIGTLAHPKIQGATKKEGIRYVKIFRGLKTEINKDGEWSITYQSPYGPDGKLKAEATGPSFIKLNKTGGMEISLKKGTIKQTHDVDSEKTIFEYKSGLKIEFDGKGDKVTYTTKGGPIVTVDGSGTITLSANSTKIIIDGSSGKISLTGSLVDVGEAASALAVLGPQMLAWLSTHTHPFIDSTPIPVPSMTQPPAVPPPSTLLSKTVKIKD